jgi:integrase
MCRAAGLTYGRDEGIVVHSGRHTTATDSLASGNSTAQTARALGNSPEQVARTYNHLTPEHVRDAFARSTNRESGPRRGKGR